jgi:GT2 family glycosyltransferase
VIGATLRPLLAQLRDGDELIVVDNASRDGTADAAREMAPVATVLEKGANLGFAAGCNRGADAASGELLCFLNPDAVVQEGWRDAIAAPLNEDRGWAAWQALITAEGGTVINTAGGVVHFTGVAWAGGAGDPIDLHGVAAEGKPGFASGACLAISRQTFADVGGFAEPFFLYHEDVDLSLRIRLQGGELGVEADARVDHGYEFEKGAAKWRYLERNRWATLIRAYPFAVLALSAPALLATELAIVGASLSGGWFRQKLAAWADVVRWLPRLLRERREIQARRVVSAGEFAAGLSAGLGSAYLGAAARSRLLSGLLSGYWRVVLLLLGGRSGGGD